MLPFGSARDLPGVWFRLPCLPSVRLSHMHKVIVWDLPTRIFHWALVASVLALVVTGNVGGNAMVWHGRLGYTVLALLLFRLLWGFVGGRWSRFSSFIYGPASILAYVRGQARPEHQIGHNPLGMLSVFALLGLLLLQVASGFVSDDEIAFSGPWVSLVSSETIEWATRYHTTIGKMLLIALVALHVLAIVFHKLVRKHDLVRPMLTGVKHLEEAVPGSADSLALRLLALTLALACGAVVWWLVKLGQSSSFG